MRDDLVAIFADPSSASLALHVLRGEEVTDAQVASPASFPAVHAAARPGRSRRLSATALCGALAGLALAIALQVITSESLGLQVGGKPIVSWTAFGVVMFELTMLFAGVSAFAALAVLAALERRRVSRQARAQVNSDRIVVIVPAHHLVGERRAAIRESLMSTAAEVLG